MENGDSALRNRYVNSASRIQNPFQWLVTASRWTATVASQAVPCFEPQLRKPQNEQPLGRGFDTHTYIFTLYIYVYTYLYTQVICIVSHPQYTQPSIRISLRDPNCWGWPQVEVPNWWHRMCGPLLGRSIRPRYLRRGGVDKKETVGRRCFGQ